MLCQHKDLAAGRWQELTLIDQLGNVGSEIGRATKYYNCHDQIRFDVAVDRGLELLDLTIADPRWRYRLRELVRVRELIGDAYWGGGEYKTTWEDLDKYFFQFALAARVNR